MYAAGIQRCQRTAVPAAGMRNGRATIEETVSTQSPCTFNRADTGTVSRRIPAQCLIACAWHGVCGSPCLHARIVTAAREPNAKGAAVDSRRELDEDTVARIQQHVKRARYRLLTAVGDAHLGGRGRMGMGMNKTKGTSPVTETCGCQVVRVKRLQH